MIHIIPRMKFTIHSGKTYWEVRHIMEAEIAVQDGLFHYSPAEADFFGEVEESEFKVVHRLPPFVRDSFRPVILGQIRKRGSGAAVDIRMRLSMEVLIFCVIWFGVSGMYFLICLLNFALGLMDGWQEIVSAAVFFFFGQLLARAGFYIPAKRAKRRLEELFGEASDGEAV